MKYHVTHRQAVPERTTGGPVILTGIALAVGLGLLLRGLIRGKGLNLPQLLHQDLWLNIAILAALTVAIGVAALVVRRHARLVLSSALLVALLIAFGWTSVLWTMIAFLAFSTLGETIMPSMGRASAASLSIQATIGAACYVLVLNVMVHFPINTPLTYGALLLLPLANLPALRRVLAPLRQVFRSAATTTPSSGEIAAGTLLVFIVALHLTTAGLPERYADGALYHLPFMQTVARLGYWPGDFHLLVWALWSAGTDWLFGVGNMLAGEMGAKAFAFLFFLLILANLFVASVRNGVRPASAILLVALFASTPLAFIETTALFIENGLALFMLCSFAILGMTECPAERRVAACIVVASAAAATKLHGFAILGPLGLTALWMTFTRVPRQRRPALIVIALAIVALGCAAYVYNYVVTGNPVFPFFNARFHSPFYPPTNFIDSRWLQPAPYDLFYRETFHTSRYGEFGDGAFGFQWLTLILAAVAAACVGSWRTRAALLFGLLYIFGISAGSTYARYLYPAFPVLTLAIGGLLGYRSADRSDRLLNGAMRRVVIVIVTALTLLNLAYFSTAGWPLSQNFWSGLFNATKWRQAADDSLPQLALNRRASEDGLPAPRVLLFNDAVSANLAGTALTVNWYNQVLVGRFRAAHSVDDIARIIRDYGASYASFRLEPSPYGIDVDLVARALETLGDPIARKDGLTLYRLHPDVWLGKNLLTDTPVAAGDAAWQASGDVEWQEHGGAVLGAGASLQQAPVALLEPAHFYRLTVRMRCATPRQNLHSAIVLERPGSTRQDRFDDFPPCNVIGDVTRTFDFVSPAYRARAHVIVDNANATFVAATLREGYPVQ